MRDVSNKASSLRTAAARAVVRVRSETIALIKGGAVPKGDPIPVVRVAGVQAAKSTSQLIPYCHPVPLDFVGVEFDLQSDRITITSTVKAIYKTGVEMEALVAASVAALTLYDMLKMIDESMEIVSVSLLSKTGGKSDFIQPFEAPPRAAVLVMSDSVAAGKKKDSAGRLIAERLEEHGVEIADYRIIPDERETIEQSIRSYSDDLKLDLVVTTGGTGLGPRDTTPEAMTNILEREAPGIAEAARAYGQSRTPYAMLSRGRAGVRGKTLIINLPGSTRGAAESLDALFPAVLHALHMIQGEGH
jgi:molybdenum cofactor biosynthesis protein MoaC